MLRIFITVPFCNLKIKSIFSNIFKTHFIYCTILWVFTQFPHIALMFSLRLINFLGCCPYEWSYFCNYLNILLYLNWFMLVYWNAVDSDTFLITFFQVHRCHFVYLCLQQLQPRIQHIVYCYLLLWLFCLEKPSSSSTLMNQWQIFGLLF